MKVQYQHVTGTVDRSSNPGIERLQNRSLEYQGEAHTRHPAGDQLHRNIWGYVHLIHVSLEKQHGKSCPAGDGDRAQAGIHDIDDSGQICTVQYIPDPIGNPKSADQNHIKPQHDPVRMVPKPCFPGQKYRCGRQERDHKIIHYKAVFLLIQDIAQIHLHNRTDHNRHKSIQPVAPKIHTEPHAA